MRILEIVTVRARARARMTAGLAVAALLVTASACASLGGSRQSSNPFGENPAGSDQIVIHIQNFNFNDATVWTHVRDARDQKLGIVSGKSDATFTVRWEFSEPLRLEFDLLASVRCLTEPLVVDPGDVVELQISVDPSQDPTCA